MSTTLCHVTTIHREVAIKIKTKWVVVASSVVLDLIATPVNQELQGTLQVTLRNSGSSQLIDDNEVRRKFQQFGDVKSVRPVNDRTEYVVKSDSRFPHLTSPDT